MRKEVGVEGGEAKRGIDRGEGGWKGARGTE